LVWLVELPHATVLRTNNGLEETAFIMVDAHTGKALYSLQSANFHT
jgi:23S rRNA A2030 N6-methylase RlmJ